MNDEIDHKYYFEDIKRRYQESQRMLEVRTKQRDHARHTVVLISSLHCVFGIGFVIFLSWLIVFC